VVTRSSASPGAAEMALAGGVGKLIEDLAGEALNGHLHNVRSHTQLRRRIADGELSEREVNEAYSSYARGQADSYRRSAADLTLRFYKELSELGAQYSREFYEQMLTATVPNGARKAPDSRGDVQSGNQSRNQSRNQSNVSSETVERVPIELHGASGREIVARFTITNTDPVPASIAFEFEPCRAPHGDSFHAPITVQPTRLELEPGGNAEVFLRAALMPSVFMPGLIYHQVIHAVGARPLTLDVTLWVEFENDGASEPGPTVTSGKSEATPRAPATGAASKPQTATKRKSRATATKTAKTK
jgi:hypothetical protein